MVRVNIVHGPWTETNTRAFFAPLFRARRELRDLGLSVRFLDRLSPAAAEADALLLDDKYFGAAWTTHSDAVLREIDSLLDRGARLVYCDLGDSSGLIRVPALERADAYWKGFLLRDRRQYLTAHYGGRLFTDYYHRTEGVADDPILLSDPVAEDLLTKLQVSWGYGLTNHGLLANKASSLFSRLPLPALLALPLQAVDPAAPRPLALSCRMGSAHRRPSVVHQRLRLKALLGHRIPTSRVSPRAFFAEMAKSRVVLSPFGWGEFAYRDYEAFLSGAALIKPAMDHLDTFPDYYQDGTTMRALRWDLSNLDETLDQAMEQAKETQDIARAAQNMYKYHAAAPEGRRDFALRFRSLLAGTHVAA